MAPCGLGSIFPASTHVLGQGVRCDSGPVGCLVHLRGKPGDLGRDVSVHGRWMAASLVNMQTETCQRR
jgi:hypothetical protein